MHYSQFQRPLYQTSSIIDLLNQLIEEEYSHPESYSQPSLQSQRYSSHQQPSSQCHTCHTCGSHGCSSQRQSVYSSTQPSVQRSSYEPQWQRSQSPLMSLQYIQSLLDSEVQRQRQAVSSTRTPSTSSQRSTTQTTTQPLTRPPVQKQSQVNNSNVPTYIFSDSRTSGEPVPSVQPTQSAQSSIDYTSILNTCMDLLLKYYSSSSTSAQSSQSARTTQTSRQSIPTQSQTQVQSQKQSSNVPQMNSIAEAQQWIEMMKKCLNVPANTTSTTSTTTPSTNSSQNISRERMNELLSNSSPKPESKSRTSPKLTLCDYAKIVNALEDSELPAEDVIKIGDYAVLIGEYMMSRIETDADFAKDFRKANDLILPFAGKFKELMKLFCVYEQFRHKYFDDILEHVSNLSPSSMTSWLDGQKLEDVKNTTTSSNTSNTSNVPTVTVNNTTTSSTVNTSVPSTTTGTSNTSSTSTASTTTSKTTPSGQSTYLLNSLLDAYKKYETVDDKTQEEVIRDTANNLYHYLVDGNKTNQIQNTSDMLNNLMSVINKPTSSYTSSDISTILNMFAPSTLNTSNNTTTTTTPSINSTTTTSTSTTSTSSNISSITPPSYPPPIAPANVAPPSSPITTPITTPISSYNDIDLDLDSILNEYQSMSNTYSQDNNEPEAYITDEYTD